MKGAEHLRKASGVLRGGSGDPRDRLRTAAHHFWSAVFHIDSWPAELRPTAEALTGRIFRYGAIDQAVDRMGDKTATEISQELLRLCDDAERHMSPS
jgi:hypothetical protein